MQQAEYHHAKHLAQQLRENIQKQDADLMSVIQTAMTVSQGLQDLPLMALSDISLGSSQIQHQANAAQADPLQLEMIKLLQAAIPNNTGYRQQQERWQKRLSLPTT